MQLGEAGARLAAEPGLVVTDDDDVEQGIIRRCADVAETAFQENLAPRLKGDICKFPFARGSYPGHLVSTHLAFWTHPVVGKSLTPELYEASQRVLAQFPSKQILSDTHSLLGRPDRQVARELYTQSIRDFEETMQVCAPRGVDIKANISDTILSVWDALETANQKGYSPEDCLRLAVRHSAVIGSLTERTSASLSPYPRDIEEHAGEPKLVAAFPERDYSAFSDTAREITATRQSERYLSCKVLGRT